MAKNYVQLVFAGDTKSLMRALSDVVKETGKTESKLKNLGKASAIGLAGMATAAVGLGVKMISLASDAEEVRSKFETVFGKQVPRLNKNIEDFAKATGASTFAMREQIANMGALLSPILGNAKAAGEMSFKFTALANDLASFNNVPVADALAAIRSGLVGEAEPLRAFGVLINDAAVKAEAYRSGIAKVGTALTEQQKVQARANLITQQTALAQGDATRTAGSFANQMKTLRNKISDTATEIGIKLLPKALELLRWINKDAIPAIEAFAEKVGPILGGAFEWASKQIAIFKSDVEAIVGVVKTAKRVVETVGTAFSPNRYDTIPSGDPQVLGGRPGSQGRGAVVPGKPAVPGKPSPGSAGGGSFNEKSWTSAFKNAMAPKRRRATARSTPEQLAAWQGEETPGSVAYAMAQLTQGVSDDLSALQMLVTEAEKAYSRAQGPAAIVEAAGALASARSNLAGLGPLQRLASGELVATGTGTAAEASDALLRDILRAKGQLPAVSVSAGTGVTGASVMNITINTAASGDDVIRAIQTYERQNGQQFARA
jgi:hypothetical protein